MKKLINCAAAAAVFFALTAGAGAKEGVKMKAIFETSMGKITVELFEDKAPLTVENFTGLAEGTKEFIDQKTGQSAKRCFYDGLKFHRVIPEFMIQGGCPLGTGTGGPGYRFKDEISDLKFDRPGRLAMANSGPATNGSQFFITETPTPWLDGKHTIFGQVAEGQDIVNKIARAPRGPRDAPATDIILKSVKIVRSKAGAPSTPAAKAAGMSKKVLMITAPINFRDEEYFEPKKAIEAAGMEVVTVSLKTGTLSGMLGGRTESDALIQDINPSEYAGAVFVGGSGAEVFWENPAAHALARHFASSAKILGAICIATVTLDKSGAVDGKKVTAFPSVKKEIKRGTYTGNRVEIDGSVITAAGPEAAPDFARALVEALLRQ